MASIHLRGLYNNILIIRLNYSVYKRLLHFRSVAAVDTQVRGRALDQDR